MIIVLITTGNKSIAQTAEVKLFSSEDKAIEYIDSIYDIDNEYWTYAQIVEEDEEIELSERG